MNEKKLVQNFKSYINVSPSNKGEKNGSIQEIKPKLLNGELVTGAVHTVVMLTPLSERDRGRFGSLFVTNYKLSFVPLESNHNEECSQRNNLLGVHDVPLTAVGAVWLTDGGPIRRRRLMPYGDMPGKVKGLQVICKVEDTVKLWIQSPERVVLSGKGADGIRLNSSSKHSMIQTIEYDQRGNEAEAELSNVSIIYNTDSQSLQPVQGFEENMKVLTFSFASSPIDSGRKIALALMHHAFPKRHDLLFAFEYREPYYPTLPSDLNMFQRPGDWKRELERCECPHWRITCINGTSDAFMLTAGETLIVPSSVLDYNLMESARHFRSGRVPIWVWGRPEGAALLRSGELLQTEQSATAESVLLEQVRRSHPKLTPPHVLYLCGNSFTNAGSGASTLPPLLTLQSAFKKLVELCTPTTLGGFWVQDSQYYSILDSSKWLRYVSNCIAFADDAAQHLTDNVTVVLQEGDGVDYSAVVSSLTQLLVDPHFRTVTGFQSLVQKEWVALGHPFCDRFGLPRPGNPKESPKETGAAQSAPVFLLFLDCVWQLTQQFPVAFQFTETYLTTLWDCAHNHIFDTFLFNCSRDRELAISKNFVQRPVWDWGEQFSEQDKALFYNPLFIGNKPAHTPLHRLSQTGMPSRGKSESRLEPCCNVAGVEIWSQCYERWLAPLDSPFSGLVQYHLHNYRLLKEIQQLNERISSLSIMSRQSNGSSAAEHVWADRWAEAAGAGGATGGPSPVSRFYPFSESRGECAPEPLDSMHLSLIDASLLLDSQSLLNAPD